MTAVVASGAGELLTNEERRRVQIHSFRNDGPGDARLLNLHAPRQSPELATSCLRMHRTKCSA